MVVWVVWAVWISNPSANETNEKPPSRVAFFIHRYIMTNMTRTKTLNNMGFMFKHRDPVLDAFLKHVENTKGHFADIGTAFGFATLEALKRGGSVLAIDLDQGHLEVLLKECPDSDRARLETQNGHFPNSIDLSENAFDGILLSRVLIFLTHNDIDLALSKLYKALKPGGSLFLTSPSHLRKKWMALRPSHEQQKIAGARWPGRTENLWEIIPDTHSILPNTIQLIDVESLSRGLIEAGFMINECGYTPKEDTPDQEAADLCYAIASK
jgi:SAM-dependent methyltransferase